MTRGHFSIFLWAALAVLVAGCASARPPGGEARSVPPSPPTVPLPGASTEMSGVAPQDVLTLAVATSLVLAHNPQLATAAWDVEAGGARIQQAGLWPNPTAGLTVEDVGGTGDRSGGEQAETTLRLGQRFELGGKRGARIDAASYGRDLTAWDYEQLRLDLMAQTSSAFFAVLGLQEQLVLADQALQLGEQVVGSVSRLVDAGREPIAEATRAEVALAAARIDRAQVQRDLAAARQRLAALWGARVPTFTHVDGRLGSAAPPPALSTLIDRLPRNPDLARWASELAQREATVALEERNAIPDVTLEAGYRRFEDTDDNGFVFGAFVPLPILNRNQGTIAEARHRLSAAREAQRAVEVEVQSALSQAYDGLSAAYAEAAALHGSILPAATRAFDSVKTGFDEGRYRYLDVLDAQRVLIATRERLVRAHSDYRQAQIRVERLIGGPLDDRSDLPDTGVPTP